MRLLAHRGLWSETIGQNTPMAFKTAINNGFGIELDVRDIDGELVVSHDPPNKDCITFRSVLDLLRVNHTGENVISLAVNIKSDGLRDQLVKLVEVIASNVDMFVFDMSVPDMYSYLDSPLKVCSRISDLEKQPVLISRTHNLWVDAFENDMAMIDFIDEYAMVVDNIYVVSPELHGRHHLDFWSVLKDKSGIYGNLSLCTDYPIQASDFFAERCSLQA